MNAFANIIAICIMGGITYLFCAWFPPFTDTAPVIAVIAMLALGVAGTHFWQLSETWCVSPLEWSLFIAGIFVVSLVVFLATCWQLGMSPSESISFPKQLWESTKHNHYSANFALRWSLALGLGALILGIGSLVRWGILTLNRSSLTMRSKKTP